MTLIVLAAPVAVPDNTRRAPAVVVMILALTPGLFGALLMAATIPCRVLFVLSMVIDVDAPPTTMLRVPVPMLEVALATGCEDRLAAVARFCT